MKIHSEGIFGKIRERYKSRLSFLPHSHAWARAELRAGLWIQKALKTKKKYDGEWISREIKSAGKLSRDSFFTRAKKR